MLGTLEQEHFGYKADGVILRHFYFFYCFVVVFLGCKRRGRSPWLQQCQTWLKQDQVTKTNKQKISKKHRTLLVVVLPISHLFTKVWFKLKSFAFFLHCHKIYNARVYLVTINNLNEFLLKVWLVKVCNWTWFCFKDISYSFQRAWWMNDWLNML